MKTLREYINLVEDASGPIDYTKPGPMSKSSMGHALEYGIPVNAKGAFINPSRLPNYEQLPDDEFGRMLTAYKTWLRDFLSRWPNGKLQPDGSMSSGNQGLAPISPLPKLQADHSTGAILEPPDVYDKFTKVDAHQSQMLPGIATLQGNAYMYQGRPFTIKSGPHRSDADMVKTADGKTIWLNSEMTGSKTFNVAYLN